MSESTLTHHGPCSACGSSDGCAHYDDGHSFCYVCQKTVQPKGSTPAPRKAPKMPSPEFLQVDYEALRARGIHVDTCQKWKYGIGEYKGKRVHVAQQFDSKGQLVGQKLRTADKKFIIIGTFSGLYGSWLWQAGGKKIVVTEGEIDALTVSQLQGNKWPVVSLSNGAQSASKVFKENMEWLNSFEEVILMFDTDEPGQKAAKEAAEVLEPGKVKIAKLPLKDPNECLTAGKGAEVINAMWRAAVYRPDGIVAGFDLWETINTPEPKADLMYPWEGLNKLTFGMRRQEITTWTAGSGIGKSTFNRELAYAILQKGHRLGYIALEESVKRTGLGLMSVHLGKPLHKDREGIEEASFRDAFDATVGSGRCFLYDHFGSLDLKRLCSQIRYLVRGCGVDWIILDHVSIIVSGFEGDDERRLIDNLMTALRSLVQETNIGMHLISHLKRPGQGISWEEGRVPRMADLRGSAAIEQLSDTIIGLSRNMTDETNKNTTALHVLKNRHVGDTGLACELTFNPNTGRLEEDATMEAF